MMMKKLLATVKNSFGDNRLTLSGEILITPDKRCSRALIECLDRKKIKSILNGINNQYSSLDIDIVNGLLEINIKFFAHQIRVANKDFLDEFSEYLRELTKVILLQEDLIVRINVFGTWETKEKIEQYRYLNKKDDVRYTIIDETLKNKLVRLFTPKIYLITGLLAIICYAGYVGYNHYFVGNNQLETVEEDTFTDSTVKTNIKINERR